ncbi:5-oxoprolinase subunit PxpB [Actinomadura rupiterrae]|uniref:5-oxoprolinase subunit PxpB n=1 Tax=Actinomadura rupiterrae TaxID=559627 RepID=UPI0020A3FC2D|nr:5-oxoprolinase subunit PxpB [Actinomadura rupiterrae]MCP2335606.1 KipI family sensor histidine kinase inhibitor [Actinomadura rupiterrae]
MTPRTIRRAGDGGLLIETASLDEAHRLHRALRDAASAGAREGAFSGARDAAFGGVSDIVPGERTVLLVADPDVCDLDQLAKRVATLELGASEAEDAAPVEIPVHYDGADLDEVAELSGLTVREVVERHASAEYSVAYLGFSPGFGYLTGLDEALHVSRRATPRTSVPAGSVAIAGPYTAVYPSPSPGGWRLLGHADLTMWDVHKDPPALLRPGLRVRFVPEATR